MSVNKLDTAWVAGFFDGEGCVSLRIEDNVARSPRITITQFGEEGYKSLLEVKRIMGMGGICRSKRNYNQYRLTSYADCLSFCKRIYSYCRRKRIVVGMMIDFCIEEYPDIKKNIGEAILRTHGRKGKRRWSK